MQLNTIMNSNNERDETGRIDFRQKTLSPKRLTYFFKSNDSLKWDTVKNKCACAEQRELAKGSSRKWKSTCQVQLILLKNACIILKRIFIGE